MRIWSLGVISRVALAFVAIAGCGDGAGLGAEEGMSAAPQTTEPAVVLLRAHSVDYGSWGGSSWTHSDYTVLVQNLAYRKEVGIRKKGADGAWFDVAARYVGPADNGREIWRAEIEESRNATPPAPDVEFAVWYSVAGKTHWDNNGGLNYKLPRGAGSLLSNGTHVLLYSGSACLPPLSNRVSGQIDVRNLAYHKNVEVVYSDDNWATTRRASAVWFNGPNSQGIETWRFETGDVNPDAVKLAVSYRVGGKTYWDNNFGSGKNYRMVPTRPTNPTCCAQRSSDGAGDGNACWF